MFGSYRDVLRVPGYRAPLLLGLFAALPLGMLGLALLLTAQVRSGSLAAAGLAPAAFGAGNAVGLLVQGRLIDRFGQTRVLVPASLACAAALAASVGVPGPHALLGFAFAAGCSFPATISSVRVLTSTLVHDQRGRLAGYALLSVAFGLVMVVGPVLTSLVLAVWSAPAAVMLAAVVVGLAGPAFAATRASRGWRPAASAPATTPRHERLWLGAGLVTLLAANACLGFSAGVTAVALPAAALVHGAPALAGVGFAAMSVGDLVGGLAFGAIRWRAPRPTQLLASMTAAAAVAWLATAATDLLPVLFGVLLARGVLGACVPVCFSALLDDVAPAGALTSSYTAMVGLGLVAGAAGNAAAGSVASGFGPAAGFALAAGTLTLAVAIVAGRRSTLRSGATPAAPVSGR